MPEFIVRSLSGLVYAALFLLPLWHPWFMVGVIILCAIGAYEWYHLSWHRRLLWRIFACYGFLHLTLFLLLLLRLFEAHFSLYILLLICVWTTDVAAYLGGRLLKGPKLAPKISPGKTWSGSISGITGALFSAFLVLFLILWSFSLFSAWSFLSFTGFALVVVITSIAGQIGDLAMSLCKRKNNVKDTGRLIPGHGGVLDRIDSLLLATPAFYGTWLFLSPPYLQMV